MSTLDRWLATQRLEAELARERREANRRPAERPGTGDRGMATAERVTTEGRPGDGQPARNLGDRK